MSFEYAKKPDFPFRTNKPLKKNSSYTAKGLYGLSSFYPVAQRVKIHDVDVDFNNPETRSSIIDALRTNKIFLHGILPTYYPEIDKQEVTGEQINSAANKLIDSVAAELSQKPKECKDYNSVAHEAASLAKRRIDSEKKDRERRSYKIGDTPMMFEEGDLRAIEGDKLFGAIRKQQGKKVQIKETIEMQNLQYTDFYSRSAMREEVTRWLISREAGSDSGMGRTSPMYRVDFLEDIEEEISLKKAYGSSTLHHIRPLSALTREYTGDIKDKKKLQQYQWDAENLVLGPDRNRRIYEPGDATDLEARRISDSSGSTIPARDLQETQSEKYKPIMMESPAAAMHTDYLQYFYSMCRKYIGCMHSAKPELRTGAPRNLVETAQLMRSRFAIIEVRHGDSELLVNLTNFINKFPKCQENSAERTEEVEKMVIFLLQYGGNEDRGI